MSGKIYEIGGQQFSTLEEFYDHFGKVVLEADISRVRLGYPETIRQLHTRLERSHPSNREHVSAELEEAEQQRRPTVFDWLVEIIRSHRDIELSLD